MITQVPWPHPGMMREVYPGFLQLSGFMGMNLDRHITAHRHLFHNLIRGDGDSADKHREFYDEFLAVMDLTRRVLFADHQDRLPRSFAAQGRNASIAAARSIRARFGACALMTVEGEKDDITGIGQTFAAHNLCTNLPSVNAAAPFAARRRSLWRVQRLPLPSRNPAENQDFIALHQCRRGLLARSFSRKA